MAVPRAKTSKARTRRRRGINMRLTAPNLVECANCGNLIQSHRVCPKCGFYKGRQVVDPDTLN
ncbi:50S ribosomal protein L32 [Treponema phagedenis]|uniref:Large ribosomal subunit protein bL32 n=1 Tax=Treponema phagedenis TaxID=162 RepID=A0AAE6IUA6_TREPH|nr:50S ribosomal protein L32 [Treponema phagedenis]NVP22773.1 50S ribosomal protein L32 [Treponema phagedenis]QEJ95273.1 50S ribosomal protein L32 [Treponema phagedenis]QEJ98377.1 50S ribosomal protein L32 [Treponema phagedenis]QEK01127.1 50S ribosomal protein L32 [Treponema phagedenis]QEK03886.1 50S ribosomal protein L32 [Treponema phagedenis]